MAVTVLNYRVDNYAQGLVARGREWHHDDKPFPGLTTNDPQMDLARLLFKSYPHCWVRVWVEPEPERPELWDWAEQERFVHELYNKLFPP